jgi:hypothetical protein
VSRVLRLPVVYGYVPRAVLPAFGFPHGQAQFSSFNATCWATMALLLAVEPAKAGEVAAR